MHYILVDRKGQLTIEVSVIARREVHCCLGASLLLDASSFSFSSLAIWLYLQSLLKWLAFLSDIAQYGGLGPLPQHLPSRPPHSVRLHLPWCIRKSKGWYNCCCCGLGKGCSGADCPKLSFRVLTDWNGLTLRWFGACGAHGILAACLSWLHATFRHLKSSSDLAYYLISLKSSFIVADVSIAKCAAH